MINFTKNLSETTLKSNQIFEYFFHKLCTLLRCHEISDCVMCCLLYLTENLLACCGKKYERKIVYRIIVFLNVLSNEKSMQVEINITNVTGADTTLT